MELLYQMSYNVTYCDVLPLLLNKVFALPNTTHHVPLARRGYSVVFCDQRTVLLQPTNHSHCAQALGCDTLDPHATLYNTD